MKEVIPAPNDTLADREAVLDPRVFDAFLDADFRAAVERAFRARTDDDNLNMLIYIEDVLSTGAVEAAQRLVAGDGAGAAALWNKIPGAKRTATQLPSGKWLIEPDGGRPYTLDPAKLLAWLGSLWRFLLLTKQHLAH